jgi:hypothetical protein
LVPLCLSRRGAGAAGLRCAPSWGPRTLNKRSHNPKLNQAPNNFPRDSAGSQDDMTEDPAQSESAQPRSAVVSKPRTRSSRGTSQRQAGRFSGAENLSALRLCDRVEPLSVLTRSGPADRYVLVFGLVPASRSSSWREGARLLVPTEDAFDERRQGTQARRTPTFEDLPALWAPPVKLDGSFPTHSLQTPS